MEKDLDLSMDRTFMANVIISTTLRRGKGIKSDPIRIVVEIFTLNGLKIAENDPYDELNQRFKD